MPSAPPGYMCCSSVFPSPETGTNPHSSNLPSSSETASRGWSTGSLWLPATLCQDGNQHMCFTTIDAFAWKRPNPLVFLIVGGFFLVQLCFSFLAFHFLIFGNLCIICCVMHFAGSSSTRVKAFGFQPFSVITLT